MSLSQDPSDIGSKLSSHWPRLLLVIVIILLIASFLIPRPRDGLFNNIPDDGQALQVHANALRLTTGVQPTVGSKIPRNTVEMFVRVYSGDCITEERSWARVHFDQYLSGDVLAERMVVGCYFHIKARGASGLISHHLWSMRLRPVDRNTVEIIEITRATRGLDL